MQLGSSKAETSGNRLKNHQQQTERLHWLDSPVSLYCSIPAVMSLRLFLCILFVLFCSHRLHSRRLCKPKAAATWPQGECLRGVQPMHTSHTTFGQVS